NCSVNIAGWFLVLSIVGLLFTLNAIRPPRFEATSLSAFFAGWLTSELPIHHIVWQAIATALFIEAGALDHPAGWIGLVITLVSWAGLLFLALQGQRSESVFEAALQEALGADYRARMDSSLTDDQRTKKAWRRLILQLGRRH